METIQLHDKSFIPYLSESEILAAVDSLAHRINTDYEGKELIFLSVLNGAFMFTSDLMKRITLPCEISFMKVSSYAGTETTGRVDELIGLTGTVKDRHVIIIEDIVDTGITIDKVIKLLSIQEPVSIEVCATLFKKEAYRGIHPPKYYGFEIPNKFVVGYGLDYDQHGRNLSAIYQVKS
jgi:hypoxanthine phosphoribosyltransferase